MRREDAESARSESDIVLDRGIRKSVIPQAIALRDRAHRRI